MILLTRTSAAIESRGMKAARRQLTEQGVEVLETHLIEREAFKAFQPKDSHQVSPRPDFDELEKIAAARGFDERPEVGGVSEGSRAARRGGGVVT